LKGTNRVTEACRILTTELGFDRNEKVGQLGNKGGERGEERQRWKHNIGLFGERTLMWKTVPTAATNFKSGVIREVGKGCREPGHKRVQAAECSKWLAREVRCCARQRRQQAASPLHGTQSSPCSPLDRSHLIMPALLLCSHLYYQTPRAASAASSPPKGPFHKSAMAKASAAI